MDKKTIFNKYEHMIEAGVRNRLKQSCPQDIDEVVNVVKANAYNYMLSIVKNDIATATDLGGLFYNFGKLKAGNILAEIREKSACHGRFKGVINTAKRKLRKIGIENPTHDQIFKSIKDSSTISMGKDRIQEIENADAMLNLEGISPKTPTAYETTPDIERRAWEKVQLKKLLNKLPEQQRKTIILKHFHGLRNYEIAEIIGVTRQRISELESSGLTRLEIHANAQTRNDEILR